MALLTDEMRERIARAKARATLPEELLAIDAKSDAEALWRLDAAALADIRSNRESLREAARRYGRSVASIHRIRNGTSRRMG